MIMRILSFVLSLIIWPPISFAVRSVDHQRVLRVAASMLDKGNISYTYGGSKVGNSVDCDACMKCLARKIPKPRTRTQQCPVCVKCSLDCSHFISTVFELSGLPSRYLTTHMMLNLPVKTLKKSYHLAEISKSIHHLRPGDLLVYKGHAVLLEKIRHNGMADVIHATGGRDLKGPGLGIQRERMVDIGTFRGPLLRVLRHRSLQLQGRRFRRVRRVPNVQKVQ